MIVILKLILIHMYLYTYLFGCTQLVFPVVMYGCENWTVKKAERRRIDAFELWCWRRLLRVPFLSQEHSWLLSRHFCACSYTCNVGPATSPPDLCLNVISFFPGNSVVAFTGHFPLAVCEGISFCSSVIFPGGLLITHSVKLQCLFPTMLPPWSVATHFP